MTHGLQVIIIHTLPLALQMIGLCLAVIIDPYIRRRQRRVMLEIAVVVFSLIIENIAESQLANFIVMPRLRLLVSIYGYAVRPLIIALFFYIIMDRRRHSAVWCIVGVNAAIYMTALFSDISFSITADNAFHRGPLGYSCHIASTLLLVMLAYMTVKTYSGRRRAELLIPLANVVLIIGATMADTVLYGVLTSGNFPISSLTVTIVSACLFYYIWLHLQFAWEHERALLAEQRIRIMMSQIQPHFLYNTLSTIQALCRIDPERASEVTGQFGQYLRQNIDSLDCAGLIPFEKELLHTQTYTEIESVRFPKIEVRYEIEESGFMVPALSVQPIVENAIRHGVRTREHGLVEVAARQTSDGWYEIIVRDNGVGFDAEAVGLVGANGGNGAGSGAAAYGSGGGAGSEHIGIRNVCERIGSMCGGTLAIESVIGEGTTVTMRIPQGGVKRKAMKGGREGDDYLRG